MPGKNSQAVWLVIAMALLVVALPGAYVAGYFLRGKCWDLDQDLRLRMFHVSWEATLFRPLVAVESAIIGRRVEAAYPGPSTDTPQ